MIASRARLINGQEGVTSAKSIGYHGPCPPEGTHRYYFRLYALSSILDLPQNATARDVELAAVEHVLAKAEYFGTYSRQH
jgi:Raf kinase inhibitor-like YbhB/YbcL family protein